MSVEIRDARFSAVVGANVDFERLATGFLFTEGPIWHPSQHCLLFSDIPNQRILRWSDDANGGGGGRGGLPCEGGLAHEEGECH